MFEKITLSKGFKSTPRGDGHTETDYGDEDLHKKLTKLEFVASHVYWDQKKLFDEKNVQKKSRDTVP